MAASTQLITDSNTVVTNGPNAATQAKSIAQAGPIMDYVGLTKQLVLKLQEVQQLQALIVSGTDATDSTNLTLLNNIGLSLV